MSRDRSSRHDGKQIMFVFDRAYAADPYRVHSIVAGAAAQLGLRYDRIRLFCEGGYRGPRFRRSHPRVMAVRRSGAGPFWRTAQRIARRLRLVESPQRWISNVTPTIEPLVKLLAAGQQFDGVVIFSQGLTFAATACRLVHIFAHDTLPRLLAVVPARRARSADIEELGWLGATLLCDGELAAATGLLRTPAEPARVCSDAVDIRFAAATPLRFTHAATYPAANLEDCPAMRWVDYFAGDAPARPLPRDVVLFVRPDWANCGSATAFKSVARYFHDNGALLIDLAIWPYGGRYDAADRDIRVAEEQSELGAALYFSLRRSASVLRIVATLARVAARMPPSNIVRQKLLQYALAAKPTILRRAIRGARISHIYLNHFFTYEFARGFIGRRRFLLDTHDIQSVNWVQGGAINVLTGRGDHFHTLLRDELRILAKAHRLSFVNQDELALVETLVPREKLNVIIALPQIAACEPKAPATPFRLLIVASQNLPNQRGLEWFLGSVWPLVLAACRADGTPCPPLLDICGSIVEDFADAQFAACTFHGPVDELRTFYARADAVLLPVVIGSGVAIKTVEAILHGRPVVATRHALRGLPAEVVRGIGHVGEAADFAAAIIQLVTSASARDAAATRVRLAAEVIRQQGYYDRLDAAMTEVRTPTLLMGSGFRNGLARATSREALLQRVCHALERYFHAGERGADLVARPDRIAFDGNPAWLDTIFASHAAHDEDYRVFGHFRDPHSLVLDVGANYGLSVASMFAHGCRSCVLSFEPVTALASCLAEVVRLNPGRCDYRMIALGATSGNQTFVMPVLNGRGITSLTTADAQPHIASLARNICTYLEQYTNGEDFRSLAFHAFAAPVRTLDTALRDGGPFGVPTDSIAAAKLDTEGTEASVLAGATDTLDAHRPLILIEGANRQPQVREILHASGYQFAVRSGDQLSLSNDISQLANGFFVHASKLPEYRSCGLLCG